MVRLTLKVFIQYDGDFVDVTALKVATKSKVQCTCSAALVWAKSLN
jgi:hypothetical protein